MKSFLPLSFQAETHLSVVVKFLLKKKKKDDLQIAPDFYNYFEATLGIVNRDPSIW